jgi:hypothetical protein
MFSIILLMLAMFSESFGQCSALKNGHSSIEQLLSFLRESKQILSRPKEADCVTFVIKLLEYESSPDAIELMVKYLDFERPLSDAEKAGFMIQGPFTIGNKYPATGTLMTFGKAALPALFLAIENGPSDVVQRNATYTIMQIFRDHPDEGIEAIKKQATIAPPPKAEKLRTAAQEALEWCGKAFIKDCQAAIDR